MGILESNSLCINKTMLFGLILLFVAGVRSECQIPSFVQGAWFSWENGKSSFTEINADEMTGRGVCENIQNDYYVNFTMILRQTSCYHCVKLLVRTDNVLDKMETPCVSLAPGEEPTVDRVCKDLNPDQKIVTLFREHYLSMDCRYSLEGVWQFAYQNRFRFTGECDAPGARIRSCQTTGSQRFTADQKFNITYKSCLGMPGTFDETVEYACLGEWFIGKNKFFAVANTKEIRADKKYRCFIKNRDDDLYIGASITAECNVLKTPEKSPERLRITPVKSEVVKPGCRLPRNFYGNWSDTSFRQTPVIINETHIIQHGGHTIYVCSEQRDSLVVMTRIIGNGCQNFFFCFDFKPLHNNIISYRVGIAVMEDDFHTVCSWDQFKNKDEWNKWKGSMVSS